MKKETLYVKGSYELSKFIELEIKTGRACKSMYNGKSKSLYYTKREDKWTPQSRIPASANGVIVSLDEYKQLTNSIGELYDIY